MFDDNSLVDVSSEPGLSFGIELIADGKVRQTQTQTQARQLCEESNSATRAEMGDDTY